MDFSASDSPVERLAYKLAHLYAESSEQRNRTLAGNYAAGKYAGALEAAALWLKAPTPFALELTLMQSVDRHGKRPAFTADNRGRKDWYAAICAEFLNEWKLTDHDTSRQQEMRGT